MYGNVGWDRRGMEHWDMWGSSRPGGLSLNGCDVWPINEGGTLGIIGHNGAVTDQILA